MKSTNATSESSFFMQDPQAVTEDAERLSKMLDAKHSRVDLSETTKSTKYMTALEATKSNHLLLSLSTSLYLMVV
jgi:hypothetical protein